MFGTPKIKAFVQGASLQGDADEQLIQFLIYITPIKHALAAEVSPIIADRLFKFDASGKPHPVTEMDKPTFNLGQIDLQKMVMHPSADEKMDRHGVTLERVQISKIHARKLFPDNPDFSLIFCAEVPKDQLSFDMMGKYFKREVFLSFEAMQLELKLDQAQKCDYCKDAAVAKDSSGKFLCDKDVKKHGVGKVEFILKKETPKQLQARIQKEQEEKQKSLLEDDDRNDTSHINKKRLRNPKGNKK